MFNTFNTSIHHSDQFSVLSSSPQTVAINRSLMSENCTLDIFFFKLNFSLKLMYEKDYTPQDSSFEAQICKLWPSGDSGQSLTHKLRNSQKTENQQSMTIN